ncbi:fused MFS/spermidine synthase [Sandarakinorhabdus oryzae]|uniref:fused MFS/spermidine synthase n=1 Tax=Sandarakinorhabdus oryzae TaxID=2675220 RepID=UPI0012E16EBE|nr:fused MFS/spermidine synthase [Sandarakinorhabdus oryzae]
MTSRRLALSAPVRPLFTATILAGSFLVFLVQPLFGRVVLPVLGGSPSVWNVAMLFYQAVLLLGYLYANQLQKLALRQQLLVHLGLFALAALTLPIGMANWYPPAAGHDPTLWLLGLLAVSIGPVFLVVSAQAPLMQAWFARTDDADAANPYFLYAASNLGSFAALLAYPLLVEPLAGLGPQRLAWSGGFVALALLVALCGLRVTVGQGAATTAQPLEPVALSWRQRLRWVMLAAVASGLLLSTTTHLTTDLMAMPLLWVVPLAIYLLSFVIAFSAAGPTFTRRAVAVSPMLLLLLGAPVFLSGIGPTLGMALAIAGLALLLALTVALHGTLALERPPAAGLTSFYLWMSVGGALGGLFCALVAPAVLAWPWEHPLLLLVAAAMLVPPARRRWLPERPWTAALILLAAGALAAALIRHPISALTVPDLASIAPLAALALLAWSVIGQRWLFVALLAITMLALGGFAQLQKQAAGQFQRSFFGVYTVETAPTGHVRLLKHGTTIHGVQSTLPALALATTTYYVPESGIGLALAQVPVLFGPRVRIGVVGLGTGTLACAARPGQRWTFYEIDPVVVAIARQRFSYMSGCAPTAGMIVGDARLTLKSQPPASYDLLAIDAFSSDAIPLHMMTREALAVYGRVLARDGLLLIHITNRFLGLQPVVAKLAEDGGWKAAVLSYRPGRDGKPASPNASRSEWVALSRQPDRIAALRAANPGWQPLVAPANTPLWSDDFASVLPVLHWRRN